jgi:hypothetical protein
VVLLEQTFERPHKEPTEASMTSNITTQPATTEAVGPDQPQTAEHPELVGQGAPTPSDAAQRLQAAATKGTVHFYRVRANGSTRAVPYLKPDTSAREVAEWIANEVDEGKSVALVATEAGLSRATVRRALAAVELAEEVEEDNEDLSALYEEGVDAIYLSATEDDDEAGE